MEKAACLYTKAAKQGMEDAQNNLGCCYEYGRGVPKDLAIAISWYEKAAAKGNKYSQYALGLFYEKGMGVEKNIEKAIDLFQASAKSGCKKAKKRLAVSSIANSKRRSKSKPG